MAPDLRNSLSEPTAQEYADAILAGDRAHLARAITLIESVHGKSAVKARDLLTRLLPHSGRSHRIGMTGVPGVGKSTLIETLGVRLIDHGRRVAVLAIDPTSTLSGGSILGDKSRMPRLSNDSRAFVRPSPNTLTPGGVGRRTREAQILCEAAGFDIVIIETVGVGQSEIMVAEMVDTFVALMLPGAGDELQGIKKGLLELAHVIAVNKADGETRPQALAAKNDYQSALRFRQRQSGGWQPPVEIVSAVSGSGIDELWRRIEEHRSFLQQSGKLEARRHEQRRRWISASIREEAMETLMRTPTVREMLSELEPEVLDGKIGVSDAVDKLLSVYCAREGVGSDPED